MAFSHILYRRCYNQPLANACGLLLREFLSHPYSRMPRHSCGETHTVCNTVISLCVSAIRRRLLYANKEVSSLAPFDYPKLLARSVDIGYSSFNCQSAFILSFYTILYRISSWLLYYTILYRMSTVFLNFFI